MMNALQTVKAAYESLNAIIAIRFNTLNDEFLSPYTVGEEAVEANAPIIAVANEIIEVLFETVSNGSNADEMVEALTDAEATYASL